MPDQTQGDDSGYSASDFLGPRWAAMAKALGGTVSNLAQLPQQAFESSEALRNTGQYDPAPIVQAVTSLAGGGVPAAEEGAAGVFGGKLAHTMNPEKFMQANILEMKGASPHEIWNQTGWFQGPDAKWRFEIPDTGATVRAPTENPRQTLADVVSHPDLFKAYPDLQNVPVKWTKDMGNAAHNPYPGNEAFELSAADPARALLPNSLHEIQHALQWREGFTPGTNPDWTTKQLTDALAKQGKLTRTGDYTIQSPDPDMAKKLNFQGIENYKRTAGEVEARNVADRYRYALNPRYRAYQQPPWTTEDRPRSVQIVSPPFTGKRPYD